MYEIIYNDPHQTDWHPFGDLKFNSQLEARTYLMDFFDNEPDENPDYYIVQPVENN